MVAERPPIEPIRTPYRLRLLDDAQLDNLREASLHILENTGVQFPSEKVLVGHESNRTPIPLELVKAVFGDDIILPFFFLRADCTISSLMHDGPKTEACIGGYS
jgi:hypothetical protein